MLAECLHADFEIGIVAPFSLLPRVVHGVLPIWQSPLPRGRGGIFVVQTLLPRLHQCSKGGTSCGCVFRGPNQWEVHISFHENSMVSHARGGPLTANMSEYQSFSTTALSLEHFLLRFAGVSSKLHRVCQLCKALDQELVEHISLCVAPHTAPYQTVTWI